ncbi:MAG: hypothetical protein NVSMB27_32760 [Ktedonobacteraceae bacterium]
MIEKHIDEVPWTTQQTAVGIVATLVPWVVFILATSSVGDVKTTRGAPLALQVDATTGIVIFFFSCLIEGAFLIAPLYYANRVLRSMASHRRLAWQALGFRGFNASKALVWILFFLLAIIAVDNIYQYVITVLHLNIQTNDQVILARSKHAPISTYATLFAAVLVAPFCEEVFFRGFIFMGLRRGMPLIWAIILSALLFAIAHGDPGSFAVLFIIGLALAFLRWRSASIWPGIILHTLNNGLGALVIVLVMNGVIKA